MAIAARDNQPRSFHLWNAIAATPLDFALDAGAYGFTARATVWGSATLQRVLTDGAGGQVVVPVLAPLTADGYAEIHLPAGWYRVTLAGITAFTAEIALIAPGSG